MSYRKIEVDGQTYEYVIGWVMVKVKGFEAVPREQVGQPVWIDDVEKIMITPALVAEWIRSQRKT
jgi:hypothetical protein